MLSYSIHDLPKVFDRSRTRTTSHLMVPNTDGIAGGLPAYSEHRDQMEISQDGFDTQVKVTGTSSPIA